MVKRANLTVSVENDLNRRSLSSSRTDHGNERNEDMIFNFKMALH